jgi:hypothetical protein
MDRGVMLKLKDRAVYMTGGRQTAKGLPLVAVEANQIGCRGCVCTIPGGYSCHLSYYCYGEKRFIERQFRRLNKVT